ncbi:acyl-CoA dehydrogenase [Nocardia panacis]|uniref:Acyl-CoA dehydrogenase n=1 Tax=Nocardia panacis TaxID=2340916 RepID=A0A3A4KEH0_9NOCA|nr:acyl-CoA dehydrogenase family protein [Nocardia panacis]RJO70849.1 acyl-CoA dehydrogenase [Nocardia panacis]
MRLTDRQREDVAAFAAFTDERIIPEANHWDAEQHLSDEIVLALGKARWLVPTLPVEAGGTALDVPTYGLFSAEMGRGCGSVRNLVAVQGMVAHAILKWGSRAQSERWVPRIAAGEAVGAFALTEPENGSDARNGRTTAERIAGGYRLTGRKKWMSFGQRAAVFLVFARLDDEPAVFLVERETPNFTVRPIGGLLGLRASELAELELNGCEIPAENLIAHGRLVFDLVATTSLDYGRYSTAWGAVGLATACLDASLDYARTRTQFEVPLAEHQLIRALLTDMVAAVEAARLLCGQAGELRAAGHQDAVRQTLIAKYFASRAAYQVAGDAVQVHGANGVSSDYPVQRHLRDAKIQEIIEGTSEIQRLQIAEATLQRTRV